MVSRVTNAERYAFTLDVLVAGLRAGKPGYNNGLVLTLLGYATRLRLVTFVTYVYIFNVAITTATGDAGHYGLRQLLVDTYRVYVHGVFVIVIGWRNRNRNCIL